MRRSQRFMFGALACGLLFGAPAMATDAGQVLFPIYVAEYSTALSSQSLMAQVSNDLFMGPYDYATQADTVGQVQRDEATRYLSRPSSGGDKSATLLFGNLSSLNTRNSFSFGGVTSIGPGRFAAFGGYQNWRDWGMSNNSSQDEDMRLWNINALYAWNVGSGWLGLHVMHTKGNQGGSQENNSSRQSGLIDTKYTVFDVAYASPVGDNGGWAVGAWVGLTDATSQSFERFIDSPGVPAAVLGGGGNSVRFTETYDVTGTTFGVYGRYNMSFGHADGQINAGISRGTYDLDNPTTFLETVPGNFSFRDRIRNDDTKRTNYTVGWTYLDRMGEKVDFAYGVNYTYYKDEASLIGREFINGSSVANFRSDVDRKQTALSIPMAARMQLTPNLRGIVGAGFNYYWYDGSSYDKVSDSSPDRITGKSDHTFTSYAAGLRYDFNDRLSAEVGWLSNTSDLSNSDRDTVRTDRWNFQVGLSF